MSNIMQYVEENLLFAPEKCYAMEDSNNISENLMNVPLITPKSTLKYTFPTSSIKDKVVQDQLEYSKLLNNNNTNPFLQNEPSNNRLEMDVSQPNLLQLWHENLQLQMQITNILGVLLSKVNTDSTIHESNKVNVDKDLLTAIKNVLLLSYKRRPPAENSTSTSSTDGNSTVYNGNGYETKSAILNKDFFNVVNPTKHFSDPTVNQQPFATTSYGNRQDFSNYFHCVKNDNEKSVTNLSTKSGKRVKQTNPFKCDFDFELESWNDSALNSLNSSSTFSSFENGSDKPKDENDILKSCNESSIHQTRNIFTETSTNSNSVKNNSFSFCNESFNCSASIDDVATSVANIVINENHLKYSSPEEKPYYLQQRTRSFIDSNVFENHKEHKLNSSSNSSNCISLLPFTGSLESPTLGNNTNIFKEHLVSPSAFSTMFDLPSLRQTIKEEGSNDISMIKNLSSTDTVCVGMENNASKNIVPKKNCDSVQQSICNISLVSSDMLNLNTTRDNLAVTNPYLENSGMRSVRAGTEDLQCLHPLAKVFLQTVELPKQMIHVFHYDDKGWLLIDEFVEVYTEFKTTVYMINLLHVLNIRAEFIEIDRHNNLVEIVTSSRFLPNITQKLLTESNELRLMSLRTALQVLYKLENISQEDIESFRYENSVSGSVKHMVWLTINAYKQLRYKVENAEQFYSVNLRILRHYNVL